MTTAETVQANSPVEPSVERIGGGRMVLNYCSLIYAYLAGIASKSLVLILVARSLGVSNFGQLCFAISYVSLFLILSDLGLRDFTTTDVARNANDRSKVLEHASRVMFAKVVLCVVTLFLMVAVAVCLGYDRETVLVIVFMSVSYLLISFVQLIRSFFGGKELMHYEAIIASIEGTILVAVILSCAFLQVGLLPLVAAWAGAMAFTTLLTLAIFLVKIGRPRLTLSFSSLTIVRQSFFFGLGPYMAVLYMNLDTVFIDFFFPKDQVGLYQAAFRLVFTSVFLASNFRRLLYPLVAKMFARKRSEMDTLLGIYHKVAFAVCAPILLFFILFARQTIEFIYGAEYAGAAPVLQLLSLAFIISDLPPSWTVLPAIGQARLAFAINATGALINCILNAILIPKYGILAGAWTSVATFAVVKILIASCFYRLKLAVVKDILAYLGVVGWCLLVGILGVSYLHATHVLVLSVIYVAFYLPVAIAILGKDILSLQQLRSYT